MGDINIETGLGYYANIHLLRSSSIRGAVRSDMIIYSHEANIGMTRISNNGEINMKGTGIRFNGGSALLNKYEGLTVYWHV